MNKIFYSLFLFFTGFIYSDFSSMLSYAVYVNDSNQWGIGNAHFINNNKGKKGIITGKASSLAVCPCLKFGVKPWVPSSTIPYNYSDDQLKKVTQSQQQARANYQGPCTLVSSSNATEIKVLDIFEEAHAFVSNLDTIINNLVNLFPDVTAGQGYESTTLLNFCTLPSSLVERINTINHDLFRWAHFENYFEKNEFQLVLDLQNLVPTTEEMTQANAFAAAIISHYCTLLKSAHLASGGASITNDVMMQKGKAIKKALLW